MNILSSSREISAEQEPQARHVKPMNSARRLMLILPILLAVASRSQAVVVSTSDKDGNFMDPANWGGVDPASKSTETFVITAGHTLSVKAVGRNAPWPVKTVVVCKGAVLNISSRTVFDGSGKSMVLDGGELNMEAGQLAQLVMDFRSDSMVRMGEGGFEGGRVVGKGGVEFARGSGKKPLALDFNNVDLTRYEGKILAGLNSEGPATLSLLGSSRNMGNVTIELNPHNRCFFTLNMADGINMSGPLLSTGRWGKLHLGNTACTFGYGSRMGAVVKGKDAPLAPGLHTPASTAGYTQVPLSNGGLANLQNIVEPASIEGSSIIILPPADQKSVNRVDSGTTFSLKGPAVDFSPMGAELCLNGGTVQSSGPRTLTGSIQALNHSVLEIDVPNTKPQDALRFSNGTLVGAGNISLSGKGGRIIFEKDFRMQDYDGKILTGNLKGATDLFFGNGGWGNATLVLGGQMPVAVAGDGTLQTLGTFILEGSQVRLDLGKGAVTVGAGSRIGEKELSPGIYTAANSDGYRSVPATWVEYKGNDRILRVGTVDLSRYLARSQPSTLSVVDPKRIRSTAKTGMITSPASWGGLNPGQLTTAQYEIAAGHVLSPGIETWGARELAIGKGGVLSLDSGNLDLGGRKLLFHEGTLRQETPESRVINGDLVVYDDHYLKDEYKGVLILNGGDLTVKGVVAGSRNKQSTLVIRRSKPGLVKLAIEGEMGRVPPAGVGYDVVVNDFAGELAMVWTKGILNEGFIEFSPKAGVLSSAKGFNAPRATLRLPANPQVKLDLKNAVNTLQIGTTIGGIFIERGHWTEEKTAGFTKVPECNTRRVVDLTPYLLNTKGAVLRISNPVSGVDKEETFDEDQLVVPETAFNPETLMQLRDKTEEWVAPFRTALQTKSTYHKVAGSAFSHSDYTYGTFPHRVFDLYAAYKILGDDPAVFEKLMVMADYFHQLIQMDPLATASKDEQKEGLRCPAEPAACASYMGMTLCAMEIWKKEYRHPGTVDKTLLIRADGYLDFAWNQNEPTNPLVGLKKYICPDGKVDPATGVPLIALNRGKFTWNSESGVWQAEAPFLEALRLRKLVTGKTEWDKVYEAASRGLTWYMDYFFRDNSSGEIAGKQYVWWSYNTTTPGQPGFQGEGPGWKDGLYKGMKIIKSGEDHGHIGADLLGFSWIWSMRRNAYGLTDERMERIANGAFYWIGNTPFGGLGNIFNPYRLELGDPLPPKGEVTGATGNVNFAKLTLFAIPRSYRNIVMNRSGMNEFPADWLWAKWLYQNRDRVGNSKAE